MKRHRFSGFTLVELLVVIGIIALLISILLPSLARAREQSRMTKCISNQREVSKGAATFQNDHRGRVQLVASHAASGGSGQSAVDTVDPTRTLFEYYDYPEEEYPGSLNSLKNKELVIWPVAYGEVAGFNFGKKNWKWGARAQSYDDAVNMVRESIEENSYRLGVCPSDKIAIGSPGWPDSDGVGDGTWTATLLAQGDLEKNTEANVVARHYYGALSYAMNEDIVGAEVPEDSEDAEIIPRCFRGRGGATPAQALGNECFGGTDGCAGRRLAGDMDKVFQPSNTIFMIDAGVQKGPNVNSAQRVMLINSDDFIMDPNGEDGLITSNVSPGIRANLGWFTYAHQEDPTLKAQVLPNDRHNGRLNILYADFHGSAVNAVLHAETDDSSSGVKRKVGVLWADGLTSGVWITPYSVGKYYDPKIGKPDWPPPL